MNYYRITICFMLLAFNSQAQDFVKFNKTSINKTHEDKLVTIILPFEVLEGYHIQSDSGISDGSIATEITFKENNNYIIKHQEFSLKQDETLVLNGAKHKVISNQFEVKVVIKLNKNISNIKLEGELYYQTCTDKQCLFPRALNFQTPI